MEEKSEFDNSEYRKVYCPPLLIELGSISEITKGGSFGPPDGGGGLAESQAT